MRKSPLVLSFALCASFLTTIPVHADSSSWSSHFSYGSAKKATQSRLWRPMEQGMPSDSMKTKEFVTLLYQMAGKPMSELPYMPARPISRLDAARWIADLTKFNTGVAYQPTAPFADTKIIKDEKDQKVIAYVYYTGIMVGEGKRFFPNRPLTRAEATIILQRVLERLPETANSVSFDVVKEPLPETVYTLVKENQEVSGLFTVSEGGQTYIAVTSGMKTTGGYSIQVKKISETNNAIYVQVEETSPKDGEMVSEVLTYPYQVVKIPQTNKRIFLITQS